CLSLDSALFTVTRRLRILGTLLLVSFRTIHLFHSFHSITAFVSIPSSSSPSATRAAYSLRPQGLSESV
ncbi:hypothetical protein TRAPUB_3445, partial [Trametes pubescens]